MPERLSSLAGLLVSLVVAFAWFWPTLQHGWRSDDFLLGYYADPTGGAEWGRALGEFARPWFGVRDLWRPMASVAFAASFEVGGGSLGFRLANVALVGLAVYAAGCLAAEVAPARKLLAAAIAAVVVLLHPASVEPAAWISARTSGLEVCFGAFAALAFVRRLAGRAGPWSTPCWLALALASKEGAAALPLAFVAIDWALRPGVSLRERARTHAPYFALLVGYFALRRLLLGLLTTAEAGHGPVSRLVALGERCTTWLAPPTPDGVVAWSSLVLLLFVLLLAPAGRRRTVIGLLSAGVLLLLPTTHADEPVGTMTGRLLFAALPVLGAALAVVVVADGARVRTAATSMAFVTALAVYATWSLLWMSRYTEEDRELAALRTDLARAAATAAPGRPMGLSMLPGLPLLQVHLWSLLGLPPFAATDQALIGLAGTFQRDPDALGLFGDAAMVHALAEFGAGTLVWLPAERRFTTVPRPETATTTLAPGAETGVFTPTEPRSALAFATIEVQLERPARRVALALVDDLAAEWAFGVVEQEVGSGTQRVTFDLSHSIAVLLQAGSGGFRGVRVRVDGEPAAPATVVLAHASVPGAAVEKPFAGREVEVDELLGRLRPPRSDLPLRLYLAAAGRTTACDVLAGGAFVFPPVERLRLLLARDLCARSSVHWFWQTPPGHVGTPWRSTLDWCRLR